MLFCCGGFKKLCITMALIIGAIGIGYGESQKNSPVRNALISEQCPAAGDAAVVDALKPILLKYKLPAIAGAIVTSDGVFMIGAAGVRKAGTSAAVTIDDKWHLGSCTKAMTATVIASLVEQGKLKWETTMEDVFPELAPRFNPACRKVTVRQMLSHQAGVSRDLDWTAVAKNGSVQKQRLESVVQALSIKPAYVTGRKWNYSNLGYVIAGAVVERVTGQSWEDVIRERVFSPLKMSSAGFGGTGTPGKIDQPWPHTEKARPTPGNGPAVDNPPVIGPAGRVHCPLSDWGRFISDQLRGASGGTALLKPESYSMLHTPPEGSDYAMGWIVTMRDWGGGTVLTHSGSNKMNYANVWFAPQRDFAVLVCINQGGDIAAKAADEACGALIRVKQNSAK